MLLPLPGPVSDAGLALMRRIDELHLEHPFMGAQMLRRQLRQEGVKVGRRHVATLMKKMGIEALAPQPGTTQRAQGHKIYPYLLRNVAITRSNQVWALEPPTFRWRAGLSISPPWWTWPVAGCWRTRSHAGSLPRREVIDAAFARHGTPEIVNTNQGSQFTAETFSEAVLGSVKYERVYLKAYDASAPPVPTLPNTFIGTTRADRIRV